MAVVKIKGMSCMHCVGSVIDALEKIQGVTNVKVDLEMGEATYDGDAGPDSVRQAIKEIGFEVVD